MLLPALLLVLASCGKGNHSTAKHPVIALVTDLGGKDAYVAQMKGSLFSVNPDVQVVDISHEVQSASLLEASYLLDKTAASFPAGTIFIVVVDPGAGSSRKPVLIHTREDKFYLGLDNGIFTHVLERELPDQVVELNNPEYFRSGELSRSLQGRDVFGPVAAHLAAGVELSKFGTKLKELGRLKVVSAATLGNKINGQVLHVDRYGNILTNIRHDNVSTLTKGRLLKISVKGRTLSAPFIANISEAPADRIFCLINGDGEFEIALRDGNAAAVNGVKAGDPVIVQY